MSTLYQQRRARLRSGVHSFPVRDLSGFPFRRRLTDAVANLLTVSNLSEHLLDLVLEMTGKSNFFRVVQSLDRPELKVFCEDAGASKNFYDRLTIGLSVFLETCSVEVEQTLRERLERQLRTQYANEEVSPKYHARMQKLKHLYGMDDVDIGILECCVLYRTCRRFEAYCDDYAAPEWAAVFAAAIDQPPGEVARRISGEKGLQAREFVEMGQGNIRIMKHLYTYFLGVGDEVFLHEEVKDLEPSPFPLKTFPVPPPQMDLLTRLMRDPGAVHLLFYGRPGTGKTELARALVTRMKRKGYLVRYGSHGSDRDRRAALSASVSMLPPHAVLVIDEADCLLNSGPGARNVDKGWINHFMDECQHTLIWITNEWRGIDRSIRRRFSFSLCFRNFTKAQRLSAWNWHVNRLSLKDRIPPAMVRQLAGQYEVDAGCISSVCRVTRRLLDDESGPALPVENTVRGLLEHHTRLAGTGGGTRPLNPVSKRYDPAALNTDVPAETLLRALPLPAESPAAERGEGGVNILFWGLPGTGKTEFAKHIAKRLGRKLLVKRMSDLQSMYLGETEKQIAAAFQEAADLQAILFLDEADSLILDRKTAVRNWETSQTNEVLTQMENFPGICICCTNLLENLDEAVLRRFTWKVKFLPLTPEGKIRLYRRYFQPRGRLSKQGVAKLKQIPNLTPGDFKTVWQRCRVSTPPMTAAEILDALSVEASYKKGGGSGPIGFGG